MEFSRLKAYTARTRNQTSLQTMKALEDPANSFLRQIPGVVGVGGGVPIRVGTEMIGAVGVPAHPAAKRMKSAPMQALPRSRPRSNRARLRRRTAGATA